MTPSAKADGFLGNGAFSVDAHWPHPGQESPREDVSRCVLISVQDQAAVRAAVPSFSQCLLNDGTAARALLARSCGIHSHDFRTGSFSLAAEDVHEAGPASIGDRTGERVVLDHVGHGQALHADQPIRPDEFQRDLVVMLASQSTNASVEHLPPPPKGDGPLPGNRMDKKDGARMAKR